MSLFTRAFLFVFLLVFGFAAAYYIFSIPLVQDTAYHQEEASARTILENVYELLRTEHENIEAYRRSSLDAYKRELRSLVDVGEGYARRKYNEARDGTLPLDKAKEAALEGLRTFLYGSNDYLWVSDYSSRLISHPDPNLHKADFSEIRDIHGNLIVPPMVTLARERGEGFHSYWWRRLGETNPVEKLSYARHFPEWQWVIGTGVYIDDIETVVKKRREDVIANLRARLHKLRICKTGYMYVFDSNFNMIIHPNSNIENTNFEALRDPVTGKSLARELAAAAQSKDLTLYYRWDRPGDPGNYVYEKISWVKYFKGFDWYVASSVYTDELKAGARALANRILLISCFALVCFSALIYLFLRRLLHPIQALSATALRVKEGDLNAKNTIVRQDEIGILATAFNEMLDRLRQNILELDGKVRERTGELERTILALRESEHLAVTANRAKSTFLANMSHELRTPLNAIIGYSEMLEEEVAGRKLTDLEPDLKRIQTAARHLLGLINDVLDLSKVEAGKIELSRRSFDIRAFMEEVANTVRPSALKSGNALQLDAPEGLGVMSSDAMRVRQILLNLLSNACKFTRDGAIRLSAERMHRDGTDWIRFQVSDTGIGMDPQKVESLFEPFVQADDSATRRYEGTGLGLTICRRFARLLGGDVSVRTALGEGSTFTVELPADGQ